MNTELMQNSTVTDKKLKIVLYKQNTCPHCVDFLPIWESLKEEFDKAKIEYQTIECSESDCDGILYIPTIKLFINSTESVEYDGKKTKKDIMSFVLKHKN